MKKDNVKQLITDNIVVVVLILLVIGFFYWKQYILKDCKRY